MRERKAILIAFSVKSGKFESYYERNKFFRELYGWKQMIRKEVVIGRGEKPKIYTYQRDGLLNEIPHKKVDQSSFIIPEDEFEKIEKFMREWGEKVMWKAFKVLLEEDIFGED
jgi:hypothetical protein